MKKLILILLPFVMYSGICNAQAPNWLWGEAGQGAGFGYCSGMAFGPLDTIYIAGRTGGSISIGGKTYNTGGGTYPYIGKLDTNFLAAPNTNGIWVNGGLNTGFDYGYDICSDNLGYLYNTGDENSGGSAYVVKFSHGGNPIHVSNTGVNNGQGYGVTADAYGDIYVTGNYSGGGVQFGTNPALPNAGGSWAGFLTKYDSTLNPIWSTYFNAANYYVTGKGVATDLQGNIYVVGSYEGPCTFYSAYGNSTTVAAPNTTATGADGNLFVVKYDSAGIVQWVQTAANAGLPYNDWGGRNRIVVDSCGNFYVGGVFDGVSQFGTLPSVTNVGGVDNMFVAKFNTKSMAWEWVQTGGGAGGATGVNQLALDKTSNVFAVGYMGASSTFDDTTLSTGNFFLAKYSNSNGDLDWIQSANIQGQSATLDGVAIDGQNYCYVVGTYSGASSTLGNFDLPNVAGGSVFVAKMDTIPPRYIEPTVDSIYCSGTGIIEFNTVGTFTTGNIFTAQLSDSSGSFANAVNIGADTATTGGTINIIIPPGTPAGTTYLIRIVSSTPPTSSLVNGCGYYYSQGIYVNDYFVTIGNKLSSSVTPTTTSICAGGAVLLSANGTGNNTVSYLWSNGATTDTTTVFPTQDTIYTVTVSSGSCSAVDTSTILVNAVLPLSVQPPAAAVCNGQTVTLSVDSTGTNYTWSPSAGLNSTAGSSVMADPSVPTTYTVSGTDSLGCTVTGTVAVSINTALPLIIYPQSPTVCSGSPTTLTVDTTGSNYTWSPTAGLNTTTGNTTIILNPTATVTYSVTGLDSIGCSVSASDTIKVIAAPNKPTITIHFDTLISSATSDNQWNYEGTPINNATNPTFVVSGSTSGYSVTVTNEANGCTTTSDTTTTTGIDQASITSDQVSIYPNPFNNDIFIKINSAIANISEWNLQLVDVLGRTLYTNSSLNYSNEINLSNLPSGFYFITVTNKTARAVFPVVKQN